MLEALAGVALMRLIASTAQPAAEVAGKRLIKTLASLGRRARKGNRLRDDCSGSAFEDRIAEPDQRLFWLQLFGPLQERVEAWIVVVRGLTFGGRDDVQD